MRWGRAGEGRRGSRILGGQEVGAGGGSDVRFLCFFLKCGFVSQVSGGWGHGSGSKLA